MGSWNKTCVLTNLPIYHGEPVYVVVLKERDQYEPCYASGHYTPILVPFESTYNDYGGGENSKGTAFDLVLSAVREKLIEYPQGESQREPSVVRRIFGEEQFFESVYRRRLQVDKRNPTNINFAMLRKDCVDAILNTWEIERCRLVNGELQYYTFTYDDLDDQVAAYIQAAKQLFDEDEILVYGKIEELVQHPDCNLLAKQIDFSMTTCFNGILLEKPTLIDLLRRGEFAQAEDFVRALLKGRMLNDFFDITRRQWIPGGHEGSQNCDYEEYKLLMTVTQDAIEKRNAELDEF